MMFPLREVDLLGVFVSPFAICLPMAFLGALIVLSVLRFVPDAVLVRSPLLELGTFALILSGLVLLLGRV